MSSSKNSVGAPTGLMDPQFINPGPTPPFATGPLPGPREPGDNPGPGIMPPVPEPPRPGDPPPEPTFPRPSTPTPSPQPPPTQPPVNPPNPPSMRG
jgi:hypothetical protein